MAIMHNQLSDQERKAGFRLLFDGNSLEGWDCTGDPGGWGIEDHCVVCYAKKGRFLFTHERFDHFELHIDYRTEREVNSGVFFRVSDLSELVQHGLEMQIMDTHHQSTLDKHSGGALYDLLEPCENAARPAGEWNHAIIRCWHSRVEFTLNGRNIIDTDLEQWTEKGKNPDGTTNKFRKAISDMPHTGRICLQDHLGKAWFRNIKLLPLTWPTK